VHAHINLTKINQAGLGWSLLISTRSQAVARIADRTASQQTRYKLAIVAKQHLQLFSRYCALCVTSLTFPGHVTSFWYQICHFLLVALWNQASISHRFRV